MRIPILLSNEFMLLLLSLLSMTTTIHSFTIQKQQHVTSTTLTISSSSPISSSSSVFLHLADVTDSCSKRRTTLFTSSTNNKNNNNYDNDYMWKHQQQQEKKQSVLITTAISTMILLFSPIVSSLPANAGLLDDYGTDFKSTTKKEEIVENNNKAVFSTGTAEINPTLRGSYYYPTAKKRYLPRIQKVTDEIQNVPNYLDTNDWESINEFSKIAENAILPLYLYQSSLDGQGLSMSNSFSKIMKDDANKYENSYKFFIKAVSKKNTNDVLQAVSDMGVAIADYRQQGRLSDDDGNIPSIDDMRRMTMRRPTVGLKNN